MKIHFKLFISVFILLSLSVIAFFITSNREILFTLRSSTENNLTLKTIEKGKSLENYLASRSTMLKILGRHPLLFNNQNQQEKIRNLLKDFTTKETGFYSISIFDENRTRLVDSRKINEGIQHLEVEYWKKLNIFQVKHLVDFSFSESLKQVVVHLVEVVELGPQSKRILVGRILLKDLLPVFSASDPKFKELNGRIFLLNPDQTIVYASSGKDNWLGKKNEQLTYGWEGDMKADGTFIYRRQMLVFSQGEPMVLIFATDQKRTLMPIREIALTSLKTLLIILLVSGIATFLLSRMLTDPILKLSQAAIQITKGEANSSFLIRTGDELQVLSIQLQRMANRLKLKIKEQIKLFALLEGEHKKTEANIQFASRIQRAILPRKEILDQVLKDHMVLYLPKDVVSGDFYFFFHQGNELVIGIADCTGHGVSGSLMSMIGYSFLVQAVQIEGQRDPATILEMLNENMRTIFPGEDWELLFGMEIGVFSASLATQTFSFSGSRVDLISVDSQGLKTHKGNQRLLGGNHTNKAEFQTHTGRLEEAWYYMASDGYRDQFGEKTLKKFQRRNFNLLLSEIWKEPGVEQSKILKNTLDDWKCQATQTDDILVFGWKLA